MTNSPSSPTSPVTAPSGQSRLGDFRRFMRERRRYWMVPLALMVLIIVTVFAISQFARLAPILYSLF